MAINAQTQSKIKTREPVINDFAFSVATKNGSGSQTSNNVLVTSLFRMGIPVNGKNLFPSNIKGLPTWYTIRASKDGYTARKAITEIVVAYNVDTATEDVPASARRRLPPPTRSRGSQPARRHLLLRIPVAKLCAAKVPLGLPQLVEN